MGDVITVKCVLKRGGYEHRSDICDALAFINPAQKGNPWHWLPVHAKGTSRLPDIHAEWEYEIRGDRLHFTPSLLDKSDNFHTDFNWNVAFAECPDGRPAHDYFLEINPEVKP